VVLDAPSEVGLRHVGFVSPGQPLPGCERRARVSIRRSPRPCHEHVALAPTAVKRPMTKRPRVVSTTGV